MATISEVGYSPYVEISIKDIIKEDIKEMLNILYGTKGSKEMENKDRTIETMFRTLIDSHTYLHTNLYTKGGIKELKNDFYSTLEFIKRTLKQNDFEKKEIMIVKKSLELIETVLITYDLELNMSKPESKSFNNIICDINQSLSERERI